MLYMSPFSINSVTHHPSLLQVSDNINCMKTFLFLKRVRLTMQHCKLHPVRVRLRILALTELPKAHYFLEYRHAAVGMDRVSGCDSLTVVVSRFAANIRAETFYRSI
jgi:hypothetical protein